MLNCSSADVKRDGGQRTAVSSIPPPTVERYASVAAAGAAASAMPSMHLERSSRAAAEARRREAAPSSRRMASTKEAHGAGRSRSAAPGRAAPEEPPAPEDARSGCRREWSTTRPKGFGAGTPPLAWSERKAAPHSLNVWLSYRQSVGLAHFSLKARCGSSDGSGCGTARALTATSRPRLSARRCSSEARVEEPVLYVLTKAERPPPALTLPPKTRGWLHACGSSTGSAPTPAKRRSPAEVQTTVLRPISGSATLSRVSSGPSPPPPLTSQGPSRQKPYTPWARAWPAETNQPAASAAPPAPPNTATGRQESLAAAASEQATRRRCSPRSGDA
mmetsp:Transcript_17014/g.55801  ORF Transcript_17014/g.55801 Transcript_17014/m.55801 type:complete len:333 (-) Transcript_17014:221-1219(-)